MRAARGALKPRPPRCCHPLYRLPLRCPPLVAPLLMLLMLLLMLLLLLNMMTRMGLLLLLRRGARI